MKTSSARRDINGKAGDKQGRARQNAVMADVADQGREVAERTMDSCQGREMTAIQRFLSGSAGALDSEIQSQPALVQTIWPSDHPTILSHV